MNALRSALRILAPVLPAQFGPAERGAPPLAEVLVLLPVAGALLGVGAWLAAVILCRIAGAPAGAFAGAIVIPSLLWWSGGWKNLEGTLAITEQTATLLRVPASLAPYMISVFFQVHVLLWMGAMAVLVFAGRGAWLVTTLALGGATLADLYGQSIFGSSTPPVRRIAHWLSAGVAALAGAMVAGNGAAGLLAIIAAVLITRYTARRLPERGLRETHAAARGIAELVMSATLVVGVIVTFHAGIGT